MTEIFKETTSDFTLTEEEKKNINSELHGEQFISHVDKANNMLALAIPVDEEHGDHIVNLLNVVNDCWFLGDPDEEYVFVD